MSGDNFNGGFLEARGARIWIFIGFVLGFAAIIAAVWVMVASFSAEGNFLLIADRNNVHFFFIVFKI